MKPKSSHACLKPIKSKGSTGIEGGLLEPEPEHWARWIVIPQEYCSPYLFGCMFYSTPNLKFRDLGCW